MIRPTKHNHPDKTLVYASYLILRQLKSKRIVKYDELLDFIKSSIVSGEFLFAPALDFLYLLGLIDYLPKSDAIEYIEKNETIKTVQQ